MDANHGNFDISNSDFYPYFILSLIYFFERFVVAFFICIVLAIIILGLNYLYKRFFGQSLEFRHVLKIAFIELVIFILASSILVLLGMYP